MCSPSVTDAGVEWPAGLTNLAELVQRWTTVTGTGRKAGRLSKPDALPFFTCHAVGACLRTIMADRPDRDLLVLSGHTHERAEARILPNLLARNAAAAYGAPAFEWLSIDSGTPSP